MPPGTQIHISWRVDNPIANTKIELKTADISINTFKQNYAPIYKCTFRKNKDFALSYLKNQHTFL